jgi:phosphatidylinositol alpha-1,6-mannosyltransferase
MFVISTRNFPPDVGGIQNLMEGLSNALVDHGPVKVFADNFENCQDYDKNSKLKIQRISGFKIFQKYRKANQVMDFIKNNHIRGLFFDHWKSLENINYDTIKEIPSFCLIHSKEINHERGSLLSKRMIKSLNKAKHIIANSFFTKDLATRLGIDSEKIRVINPGSNYPIKIEDKYSDEAKKIFGDSFPKIITVARLDKRKSHQNILMTIKNLKTIFPKIKYISIGDGEERENLQNLERELNINNEITFLHRCEEQLKAALMKESDLFLMPSIIAKKSIEGFGISYIEAASFGTASIGGCSGGEKDAIKNEETGYLCNGENLNSIYETIIKFFENNNYKKLGINAMEFSKKFRWNKIIKNYLELM